MLPNTATAKMPLPKGWPRRVRSAVIHTICLARTSLTYTRSWAANSFNARVRLKEENERLQNEISLLQEEGRIKDVRMEQAPPQRRPHYPPIERLAILELRTARGWSLSQTAERFLVTPLTIANWTSRLDDEGPDTLVQTPEPVNRFPEFVAYIVRRLKVLCPTMGKARIAQFLCRAGLHLGSTTVRRMLRDSPRPKRGAAARANVGRVVTACRPNHVWHVDLTTVPTSLGFWVSWLPFALPQVWPFCWWLAVAVDHFSRRVMKVSGFSQQPSSKAVQHFLDLAVHEAGVAPDHLITDKGT
jgi:transcriptional regulator with XRE-family HTH domain